MQIISEEEEKTTNARVILKVIHKSFSKALSRFVSNEHNEIIFHQCIVFHFFISFSDNQGCRS